MLKANRIEPGSQRRRVKKHNPWILCGCNRQCYITFITGCYTCEWQIKQEKKSIPGPCCCSWVQKHGKELDPASSDVGNMGWSLLLWGLIRISRTGHGRALVLRWKACCSSGARVNLTETHTCFPHLLSLSFTSPFFSTSFMSFIYSLIYFCSHLVILEKVKFRCN